ncbi:MAG: SWIM zinc finger family protein, partial [Bryobacteraceae bacterium]
MANEVSGALKYAVVRRLAGERSYERGLNYYSDGRVETLAEVAGGIRAVVGGTRDYTVNLSSDEGVLNYDCDCPYGSDGAFCKHCVAAALAWLNRDTAPAKAKPRGKVKEITLADAAKVLRDEDKDTLMRMMLEWAKDDDRLHERLLQYAARRSGPESGVAAASRAFERAVRVHDFVHYREASAWARGVDDAIDNITRLLQDGQAAAVIELCESALQRLVSAAGAIDDSDGHLSVLRDRLQDIHFRACQGARPDPVALGRRLFEWELHSELDVFYGAAERYKTIL